MTVTLIMTITADGCISRDIHDPAAWVEPYETFFNTKSKEIGTVIMGMNSYRLVGKPFEDRLNIVMCTSPTPLEDQAGCLEFFSGEPWKLLRSLEKRGMHHVALIGGSQINSSFLIENLVDEIYLTVAPQLFGKGLSMASEYELDTKMKLIDVKTLKNDAVLLHYEIMNRS